MLLSTMKAKEAAIVSIVFIENYTIIAIGRGKSKRIKDKFSTINYNISLEIQENKF